MRKFHSCNMTSYSEKPRSSMLVVESRATEILSSICEKALN